MAEGTLDVLVVGGGIAGAAAARDAAMRGLRVGLLEGTDFGAGTTSGTTRLAHGGLRYLEHFDIAQVRLGLRERAWLLRAAPHLVEPLPFLFPLPKHKASFRWKVRAGLIAYDALGGRATPRHRFLRGEDAQEREPRLRNPGRAAWFHDARIASPERLVLEFALAAAGAGALVANHAPVVGLGRENSAWRATVVDGLSDSRYDVLARVVLNCAGPWVQKLAGLAGIARPLTRTTRGTHVAFPAFLRHAVILRAGDGRTFFAVPWNEVTLIGTTDLDEPGDPSHVVASSEEVRYLLREAGAFLDLADQEPCYTTAGVRAMPRVEGVAPGAVPRGHIIVDHAADGAPGLLSVVGGKLTTARATSADTVDAACRALGRALPRPRDAPLPGAGAAGLWGRRAPAPDGAVCERHATQGMVRLAVEDEMACTLSDLLLRRTLCAHAPDLGAHGADAMARAMGALMGWSDAEREAQLEAFRAEVARRRAGLS